MHLMHTHTAPLRWSIRRDATSLPQTVGIEVRTSVRSHEIWRWTLRHGQAHGLWHTVSPLPKRLQQAEGVGEDWKPIPAPWLHWLQTQAWPDLARALTQETQIWREDAPPPAWVRSLEETVQEGLLIVRRIQLLSEPKPHLQGWWCPLPNIRDHKTGFIELIDGQRQQPVGAWHLAQPSQKQAWLEGMDFDGNAIRKPLPMLHAAWIRDLPIRNWLTHQHGEPLDPPTAPSAQTLPPILTEWIIQELWGILPDIPRMQVRRERPTRRQTP